MQAGVYLWSQAGCCNVVASLDADSGMTIRGAWAIKRCQRSKDNWPMLRDDTLVMHVVVHECGTFYKSEQCGRNFVAVLSFMTVPE